ncbi:hypothetical protein V1517DRAFT_54372 [Lipomyces orientalis]|uniref:Uncharacterized protein n=1 Tax=Lipomyces orientalis TaxID=1233043 RepID=A0ACC3TUG3_9ASCO
MLLDAHNQTIVSKYWATPSSFRMTSPSSLSPSMSQSRPVTGSVRGGAGSSGAGGGHGPPTSGSGGTRQRSAIACRYCRRRKIRCAGFETNPADPRCTNCIKFNQPCIFTPVSAIVGVLPSDYSTIGRTTPREPMYQAQQTNSYSPLTSPPLTDLQQQHQQYQFHSIAPTQPPSAAVAPSVARQTSPILQTMHQPFQHQSFTGQALLPPVRISSDVHTQRAYSTTDPTLYRHSTVRRPGSEAHAMPYYSPPSRAHSISSTSSTLSDPGGVPVPPPSSSFTAAPLSTYNDFSSPSILTQSTHFSPVSPYNARPQMSASSESPGIYGYASESPAQSRLDYVQPRPQVPQAGSSTTSESASSSGAYLIQYTPRDDRRAELSALEARPNVASSRPSISNLLDPTGDTPSSMRPSTDQDVYQNVNRSDRH